MEKCKDGSFVHRCVIVKKEGDDHGLFHQHADDHISAYLDGYAIIPVEEYEELKEKVKNV
jgi:hypothetical protein